MYSGKVQQALEFKASCGPATAWKAIFVIMYYPGGLKDFCEQIPCEQLHFQSRVN
jgi:hypothetical protein